MEKLSQIPIIQCSYNVNTQIQKLAANYPVNYRHTLGMRLAHCASDLFTEILRTNASWDYKDRLESLLELRTKLFVLGMEVRLGKDLKIISTNQHSQLHEKLIDIRKQLHRWQRWTEKQS